MRKVSLSTPNEIRPALVDSLLQEQRSLTAADEFSAIVESGRADRMKDRYRSLLPLSQPSPGEQYAFEVDLDRCSGCKACVAACHSLNGLEEDETWRRVGLLVGGDWRDPLQATVTTACHHCVDPACANGCPVLAYEKDESTGIVRHLDDQCIGCQYCVMMCPYEVPQYRPSRGIVRKCDMCHGRLAVGEAPACAQACPTAAIKITLRRQEEVVADFRNGASTGAKEDPLARNLFLPSSPDPAISLPTTRYVTKNPQVAALGAADAAEAHPGASHAPLAALLILTQASVGVMLWQAVAGLVSHSPPGSGLTVLALALGVAGVLSGSIHLGQPLKAWRAFLGWRKSWFSREVILFGVYLNLAAASVLDSRLTVPAVLAGLGGVFCSAMIYVATRRIAWSKTRVFSRFAGTTWQGFLLTGWAATDSSSLVWLLILTTFARLALEMEIMKHEVDDESPRPSALARTARLLSTRFGRWNRFRVAAAMIGGVVLPFSALAAGELPPHWSLAAAAVALLAASELLERSLFFVTVSPPRMPGGVA